MGFWPYLRHAHESGGGGPSPLVLARSPHSEIGTDTTLFSTDLRLRLGGGSGDDGEGWSRLLWPPPGDSASAGGCSSTESARGESVPVLQSDIGGA